jgi:riboflavin kinase/FMN adenylyltransferase
MKGLVIGPDFALGKGREGNIESLKALGEALGFSVTVVPPRLKNGHKVSSTLIRKAMAESDMKKVHDLLGRCFSLEGRVVTGEGRGAKLGIPTANLEVAPDQALPADGVYATVAFVQGKSVPAITNIGTRPTFGAGRRTVETHVLDFDGQLYGSILEIAIIEQIRPEEKFASADALKTQIAKDILKARQILMKTECSDA